MTTAIPGRMRPDTRAILRVASIIVAVGIAGALLVAFTGGMGVHGPRNNNVGWLGIILACGCIPLGAFFLLLGFAKFLGDRNRTD